MLQIIKTIWIGSLISICSFVYANDYVVVVENGVLKHKDVKYYRGHQVLVDNWHETAKINAKGSNYTGIVNHNATVQSAATGAKSVNTIPAAVTRTVPKREVISKVFSNGRVIGARVLKRGIPIVGQLALAWELADAVAKQKGYHWSDNHRNWVKPADGTVYFMMRTSKPVMFNEYVSYTHKDIENWCMHVRGDCSLPIVLDHYPSLEQKLSLCGTGIILIDAKIKKVVRADDISAHRECMHGILLFSWGVVSAELKEKVIPLSESEFVRIAESTADSNPSTWVKAAKPETLNWSEPEVTVPNGMAAQSSPYTNAQGQAGQTRWTFSTPKGSTSSIANEEFILRPDLKPNSPEAPILAKPESNTDASSETDSETESGGDGKKPPPPSESDLCEKHPDILACQQMGEAEESIFDGFKIPELTDKRTWEEDQFLPSDGICPAPKNFHVWGKQFSISYEPLCELMRKIRFAVLLAFIIMSAYVTFGSLRRKE